MQPILSPGDTLIGPDMEIYTVLEFSDFNMALETENGAIHQVSLHHYNMGEFYNATKNEATGGKTKEYKRMEAREVVKRATDNSFKTHGLRFPVVKNIKFRIRKWTFMDDSKKVILTDKTAVY